jgi:mono/diheme cytochrome c family protein
LAACGGLVQAARAESGLDDQQLTGMRLFNQSCRVCHIKPQVTSPQYAPPLSRESLGGQDDVMREVIGNGTPRMPGFKVYFKPEQIDAIVAYLKTVPPQAVPAPALKARGDARDAD